MGRFETEGLNVLVVEDSPTQAELLRTLLEGRNCRVSVASNGQEALAAVEAIKPDVIISDIVMPMLDGFGLCEAIRARPSVADTPFVLLTSLNNPSDIIRGLECGADNFLVKPVDEDYLFSRLDFLILNRRLNAHPPMQVGLEVHFSGKHHFITAQRQQILHLLMSTFEAAVRKNDELIATQEQLRVINESLEERVSARTAELTAEIERRRKVEDELTRVNQSLEQQVAQRTAQLSELNAELELFSAMAAHDLRAPLRHIRSYSQLLLEDQAGKLNEKSQHYLQRIEAACSRMSSLIVDLLNFSRSLHGGLNLTLVSLSKLAEPICAELQAAEPERKVEFLIEPELTALADEALVRMALENLLSNAFKFTRGRELARIHLGRVVHKGQPMFVVEDNGVGFDMQHVTRLFGVFQRLHPATEFAGTGLGLALVQRIVRRHGGEVAAVGEPGKGAKFYLTLAGR